MGALDWLTVVHGDAPLLVSIPHTGLELGNLIPRLVSPWLARKDADWWIETLYDFAGSLGATIVRTTLSRTLIDVNRYPSGASLYPGQATTELCPTMTFDGEPLYRNGQAPDPAEILDRRRRFFDPYHAALKAEVARLRAVHPAVVVYDCHAIRSVIPRLFDGTLPHFNLGTNAGLSCNPRLTASVETVLARARRFTQVTNGRFKGGFITRSLGTPQNGVHTIQMELACRGYTRENLGPVSPDAWPAAFDPAYAAPMRAALVEVLEACLAFARHPTNLRSAP